MIIFDIKYRFSINFIDRARIYPYINAEFQTSERRTYLINLVSNVGASGTVQMKKTTFSLLFSVDSFPIVRSPGTGRGSRTYLRVYGRLGRNTN